MLRDVKQRTPLADRTNRPPAGDDTRSGWGIFLVFLLVPLCCGLPLIVGVLAVTSALVRGVVAGIIVVLVGAVVTVFVRRRMRANAACSVQPPVTGPSSDASQGGYRP